MSRLRKRRAAFLSVSMAGVMVCSGNMERTTLYLCEGMVSVHVHCGLEHLANRETFPLYVRLLFQVCGTIHPQNHAAAIWAHTDSYFINVGLLAEADLHTHLHPLTSCMFDDCGHFLNMPPCYSFSLTSFLWARESGHGNAKVSFLL